MTFILKTSNTVNRVESFPAFQCDPGDNRPKPIRSEFERSFTDLSYRAKVAGDNKSPRWGH